MGDLPLIFVFAGGAHVGIELKGEVFDGEVDIFSGWRGAKLLERFVYKVRTSESQRFEG